MPPDPLPDSAALQATLLEVVEGKDLSIFSLAELRQEMSLKLGLQSDALECRREDIKRLATEHMNPQGELEDSDGNAKEIAKRLLEKILAQPEKDVAQRVYLLSVVRALASAAADGSAFQDLNTLEREAIGRAVLDALDNPVPIGQHSAGRRRQDEQNGSLVALLVVFKEFHADGDVHFHVALKLVRPFRFQRAKRTLQERHRLPCHFSCSHSLMWSTIRYGYMATPAKPDVDETPWIWTPSCSGLLGVMAGSGLALITCCLGHATLRLVRQGPLSRVICHFLRQSHHEALLRHNPRHN